MNYFKYTVNNRLYFVNFRHYLTARPRIKCYILDYDLDRIYVGTAKLNITDGDTFDEKLGESIAFERALKKRDDAINNMKVSVVKYLENQKESDKASLVKKFKREQSKFQNCIISREEPSVLPFPGKKE